MGKYWSTLSIELHDPHPRKATILLNGERVPGLRAVTVEWEQESITIATLVIAVDELHVDAETMIQLRASLEARQPETRPTIAAPLPGDDQCK